MRKEYQEDQEKKHYTQYGIDDMNISKVTPLEAAYVGIITVLAWQSQYRIVAPMTVIGGMFLAKLAPNERIIVLEEKNRRLMSQQNPQ